MVAKKPIKDKKGKVIDVVRKMNDFRAVGRSFSNKGKPTVGQHFADAAEIIELQAARIAELEAE